MIPVEHAGPAEQRHKALYLCDKTKGHEQCSYLVPSGDALLCCVLQEGHPGQHCHAYVTPSPLDGWFRRSRS